MPYFTFSLRGTVAVQDSEPILYPDLATAVEDARRGARDLMSDGEGLGRDRRHWRFDIQDEAGDVVGSVTFGDAVAAGGGA